MPPTSVAWRRRRLTPRSDRALTISIRVLLAGAAVALVSCRPRPDQLTFQVKVSDLRRAANALAKGKRGDDLVEVRLPGQLRNPPAALPEIARRDADWSTPEQAAAASISAELAGDASWIAESYVPSERAEVRRQFSDPALARRTSDYYRGMGKIGMTGWAELRGFRVVFLLGQDPDGDATVQSLTLAKTDRGWHQTNALADDDTFEVIWTALHTGGVR